MYTDNDDRTVYVRIGYDPDDNEPVYADLDKKPQPILPSEKVLFDVEEVDKNGVMIPQVNDFPELNKESNQQDPVQSKSMINGKTVHPKHPFRRSERLKSPEKRLKHARKDN